MPFDVVDRYGENRMIEKPTITIVPVGIIPPNVLAEFGATVATSFEAKVIVAPSIQLAPSVFDERRGQHHSTEILQTLAAFCACASPWAECSARDRSCRSSLAPEDGFSAARSDVGKEISC